MLSDDQSPFSDIFAEYLSSAIGESKFDVISPITERVLGSAQNMSVDHVQAKINAAAGALGEWQEINSKARAALLHTWSMVISKNQRELTRLIHLEQGKTIDQAEAEVLYGAGFIDWYAEEGRRIHGEIIPAAVTGQKICVVREPVGVCAAITPWNYPLAMVTRKIAPALAAGCTVVLKPSEATPLTALVLRAFATIAGIPEDVFAVATASNPEPIGELFTRSNLIRHLSFTGSVRVGTMLLSEAAHTVKRCTMELGGNAPFIVCSDADLHSAVEGLIASKFRNSGQTCVCPNRILVQDQVYRSFVELVAERVESLKIFGASASSFDVGPLITPQAAARIRGSVVNALRDGAVLRNGTLESLGSGRFVPPVIIENVSADMDIAREEVFGPVLSFMRFHDDDEAICMANDTVYGLAAYCFTSSHIRADRFSRLLDFGLIGVNDVAISQEIIPFGGFKSSGIGREASRFGMNEYLEIKAVCARA